MTKNVIKILSAAVKFQTPDEFEALGIASINEHVQYIKMWILLSSEKSGAILLDFPCVLFLCQFPFLLAYHLHRHLSNFRLYFVRSCCHVSWRLCINWKPNERTKYERLRDASTRMKTSHTFGRERNWRKCLKWRDGKAGKKSAIAESTNTQRWPSGVAAKQIWKSVRIEVTNRMQRI